jgi:hypothetical protein
LRDRFALFADIGYDGKECSDIEYFAEVKLKKTDFNDLSTRRRRRAVVEIFAGSIACCFGAIEQAESNSENKLKKEFCCDKSLD